MINKRKVLNHLIETDAIKNGNFTLSSGEKSDIYINIFNAISDGYILKQMTKELDELIADTLADNDDFDFNYTHAVPYRAIPLAVQFAVMTQTRYGYSRKNPKEHGDAKDSFIIGDLQPGDQVIIIKDVITTGKSVDIEKAKLLAAEPSILIMETFCIVNRGNYPCKSLLTLDEIKTHLKNKRG
jgi:orotate phosphoribosyltransferase